MTGKQHYSLGLQTTAGGRRAPKRRKPESAEQDEVRVADDDKVFAAAERIAARDRELLDRLAR